MPTSSINYARLEGIQHKELPAAIIFAALYIPCIPIFLYLSFKRYTVIWRSLSLFVLVRATAFIIRAILAANSTAGTSLNLVIAEQVIYGIGFFGLLYSAYTLVLDRDLFVNAGARTWQALGPLGIVTRVMRNRMLIRFMLVAAVVMGIVGGVEQGSSSQSDVHTGNSLRKASLYIFLVVACMLFLVTITLIVDERSAGVTHKNDSSLGYRYGIFVLFVISFMCIIREAYLCATSGDLMKQNRPALFYPLAALTEFIAAVLFLIPGLVPTKQELEMQQLQTVTVHEVRGRGYTEALPMHSPDPQYTSRRVRRHRGLIGLLMNSRQ